MSNMKPDSSKISITDNLNNIRTFLSEVIFSPRANMHKWAQLTNQTPNLKIGYPGQHLASLITGMPGTATGARGADIIDGTEVKSCSRVDQVDECMSCGSHVMRVQTVCPNCKSNRIKRKKDSKWLIAIRNKKELDMYLNSIPRMLFLISDYPNFHKSDFSVIRISSYEIWNQSDRAKNFRALLKDYYRGIYKVHVSKDREKTPAPKNFWPYSYQFYLCNPIKTFECIVNDADSLNPNINITHYIAPDADRSTISSVDMPISILNKRERKILQRHDIDIDAISMVTEEMRSWIPLRDTSRAKPQKNDYHRL